MAMSDNYPLIPIPGRDGIWHIYARSPGGGGDAFCHLIPGKDAAILLDTGFGIGDLKSMVVTIHALDAEGLKRMMDMPPREVPAEDVREYKYVQEDLVQPCHYDVESIEDGYLFDLGGGYEFEVFHLPGHSPGGIALLDKKRRALFSGDAIVWTPTFIMSHPGWPTTPYHTVEKFREGLTRLVSRMDDFDILYPGHSRQGLPTSIVTDMAACCDELLAGDTSVQYRILGQGSPVHVHGMAKIAFSEDLIHVK